MVKPTQRPVLWMSANNDDKLDATEGALLNISSAMDCLRGYGMFSNWFDALGDLFDEIKSDYDKYYSIACEEQEREERQMNLDYERSTM